MSDNHDVSKLDDLIITLIDSVKGFEHSAEKAEAARYKGFFLEMAQDRRAAVTALQEASRDGGGEAGGWGAGTGAARRPITARRRRPCTGGSRICASRWVAATRRSSRKWSAARII